MQGRPKKLGTYWLFATNTKARKIQLETELHTIEKKNMFVNDYALNL